MKGGINQQATGTVFMWQVVVRKMMVVGVYVGLLWFLLVLAGPASSIVCAATFVGR